MLASELEAKVTQLTQENNELRATNQTLREANTLLRNDMLLTTHAIKELGDRIARIMARARADT